MTTVSDLHPKAMDLAEEAFRLQRQGRDTEAHSLFLRAQKLEQQAAQLLPLHQDSEPSRSILFRSAASLAYNAEDYDEAERLIAQGLSGYPPPEVKEELKNLYQDLDHKRRHQTNDIALTDSKDLTPRMEESLSNKSSVSAPPLELTKELMVSLSKEIETTMNGITAFRTKIGFGMFVGPFVLLGSILVAAKGLPVSFNLTWWGRVALIADGICFLAIGFIAAKVEAQGYEQCDKWRVLIGKLREDPTLKIDDHSLIVRHRAYIGYLLSFVLVFASVLAAVVIIKNSSTVESQKLIMPAQPSESSR